MKTPFRYIGPVSGLRWAIKERIIKEAPLDVLVAYMNMRQKQKGRI